MSQSRNDAAELRARFDAEVLAADLAVPAGDREHLLALWADHQPIRERLRAATIELAEEPSFTQKPAQAGAGITLAGGAGAAGGGTA